jgi:hypothetical protein
MHPDYSYALDKRQEWLRYAYEPDSFSPDIRDSLPLYKAILKTADTYVMNRKFCELVDVARRTMPNDIKFDPTWITSKTGWLYATVPFEVPRLANTERLKQEVPIAKRMVPLFGKGVTISAIGWDRLSEEQLADTNAMRSRLNLRPDGRLYTRELLPGATQFCVFLDHGQVQSRGFSMWSYFVLNPGDMLDERRELFEAFSAAEASSGAYLPGSEELHEVRWIYTALHLMSQRLATTVPKTATRGTRKRLERERTPVQPEYRIVTLRRMEEDREKAAKEEGERHSVEWQWSWTTTGHWRRQWYPVEQEHRTIWIDEYVKGPLDKPLKPRKVLYRAAK